MKALLVPLQVAQKVKEIVGVENSSIKGGSRNQIYESHIFLYYEKTPLTILGRLYTPPLFLLKNIHKYCKDREIMI